MAANEKVFWYSLLACFLVILLMGFANPAMFAQGSNETAYLIKIRTFGFVPSFMVVNSGSTVTWTNQAGSAQILSMEGVFGQQILGPGMNWTYKFNRPGVYEYRTQGQVGILVVD
jgi:plastocyanin